MALHPARVCLFLGTPIPAICMLHLACCELGNRVSMSFTLQIEINWMRTQRFWWKKLPFFHIGEVQISALPRNRLNWGPADSAQAEGDHQRWRAASLNHPAGGWEGRDEKMCESVFSFATRCSVPYISITFVDAKWWYWGGGTAWKIGIILTTPAVNVLDMKLA